MRILFAAIAGGLFGTGLLVSGMTDTTKVQGWLDIFGAWDPTLAFVMGGAIIPMALAWWATTRRAAPVLGGSFPTRPPQVIDRGLIVGSTLFGAGWALAGLCPGPALASLGWTGGGGLVFLAAMGLGMVAAPSVRSRMVAVSSN
jgi:uncharacterized protein